MRMAIVTGASSGLGRALVDLLCQDPAYEQILLIARHPEEGIKRAARSSPALVPFCADLTDIQAIGRLEALLAQSRPDVRLLVNCAGFGKIGTWDGISAQDSAHMIDLNCRASVLLTRAVLPYMQRGARILNICSTSAFQPFPYLNLYAASKSFLYRYSRALGFELRGTGISVTAACPYWLRDTAFIPTAQDTADSRYIRHFPFPSTAAQAARRILLDCGKRRAVSTPGWICSLHRVIAKVMPDALLMRLWNLLRRL